MRKIALIVAMIFSILLPSFVYAEDDATSTSETMVEKKAEARKNLQESKDALKAKRIEALDEFKQKRIEAQEALMKRKEELKEEWATKKEEFKERVEAIKDEKKQALLERIDDKLTSMNQNHTERMNKVLDTLSEMVGRISEKAAVLKTEGKNTTGLEAAITAAQAAIATADQAVSTQAAKDYTPTIGTEATLRTTVGSTVSQFRADMKIVFEKVLAAKAAVRKAHTELVQLRGDKTSPTATGSANVQ